MRACDLRRRVVRLQVHRAAPPRHAPSVPHRRPEGSPIPPPGVLPVLAGQASRRAESPLAEPPRRRQRRAVYAARDADAGGARLEPAQRNHARAGGAEDAVVSERDREGVEAAGTGSGVVGVPFRGVGRRGSLDKEEREETAEGKAGEDARREGCAQGTEEVVERKETNQGTWQTFTSTRPTLAIVDIVRVALGQNLKELAYVARERFAGLSDAPDMHPSRKTESAQISTTVVFD